MPTPPDDLDAMITALRKRGFRQDDPLLHDCSACSTHAVVKFSIAGRVGGRDIAICTACGHARSWRSDATFEKRVEDEGFDLRAFVR